MRQRSFCPSVADPVKFQISARCNRSKTSKNPETVQKNCLKAIPLPALLLGWDTILI
jgi:hypothetical protein